MKLYCFPVRAGKLRKAALAMLSVSLMICLLPVAAAAENAVPVPSGLPLPGDWRTLRPEAIPEAFLNMPYRVDGAMDETGGYTLFADRSKRFSTPGLNCSGLVLGASRFMLGRNITLDEAVRDRNNDSGPGARDGEDWDFGWDLILNISEGFPRRFLLPGGAVADPAGTTGFTYRGYDFHDGKTWRELSSRFLPGRLYLLSLNVEGHVKGYGLQHYHVGLVHVADSGEAWFYQTTGKGAQVNRRDLKSAQGQASFNRSFANNGKTRKMLLVLEVDLPHPEPGTAAGRTAKGLFP